MWLWPYIEPYLDPNQWGGRRQRTHYLVKLFDFVHTYLDKTTPHAVVAGQIDLDKAYNRASHHLLIEYLHAMKVPGWLLVIMMSFLTSRKLMVRCKGATSLTRTLTSCASAGCRTGNLIFIVKFNGALMRPPIPRPITRNRAEQVKYIDDQSVAVSINMRKSLIKDPSSRPRPLNYHERFEPILKQEENVL